jgi:hypothetical protein
MKRTTVVTLALVLALSVVPRARAGDGNGNGFNDDFERAVAVKFCPALVLEAGDNHVSPEPVEIMGPIWAAKFVYTSGEFVGELETAIAEHDYSQYDSWNDMRTVNMGYTAGDYGCGFADILTSFWHWDYAGTGGTNLHTCGEYLSGASYDQPAGWHDAYENGRPSKGLAPGGDYPHTTYVHLFKRDGEYVLQYWFFYPFNDWVSDHEGDWEHINVIVTSDDPTQAQLDRVVYYFHNRFVVGLENQLQDPANYDYHVVDNTHPVVFVGGHASKTIGIGGTSTTGSGYGSHGSYPATGTWFDVVSYPGIDGVDDEVHGDGDYVDWREFVWSSCQGSRYGMVLIRNTNTYNFAGADRAMSWLSAKIPWGYPFVHSLGTHNDALNVITTAPINLGNFAPMGPAQHDNWTVVDQNTDDATLYGIGGAPEASDTPFDPPSASPPPDSAHNLFLSVAEPLYGDAELRGTTCIIDHSIAVEWGVGANPSEWSDEGVDLLLPNGGPFGNATYARWQTALLPDGTYTLRVISDAYSGLTLDERRVVEIQHRTALVAQAGGQFTSIQAAINWATYGDTVYVAQGQTISENFLTKSLVHIVGQGSGATIIGQGNAPTVSNDFYDALPCEIENLTFRHSVWGDRARAFDLEGVHVIVRDCTIENHRSGDGAGALVTKSSNVVFERCIFQNNNSDYGTNRPYGAASAIAVRGTSRWVGPVLLVENPTVSFVDCVFRYNETGWHDNSGLMTATVAIEYESLQGDDDAPRFERCSFYQNLCSGGVAAVYARNAKRVEFIDCEITDNCVYDANPGFCIRGWSSGFTLEGCTIANNSCFAEPAERIEPVSMVYSNGRTLDVRNTIIAFHNGPALKRDTAAVPLLENCIFFGNAATGSETTDEAWQQIGENVYELDPAFCLRAGVNGPSRGDYRLYAFSPAAVPTPPNPGYFGVGIGALEVGCVPPAVVTAAASDTIPGRPDLVIACPKGDLKSLVVKVDFNGPITRNIDWREITLDVADCAPGVRAYDQSGFVEAQSDAVGPDYKADISHSYFGGSGVNDVDVLLNGHPLASPAHFEIRSPDISGDGVVDLVDFSTFGPAYTSPPKPYNSACDFGAPLGTITLPDFSLLGAHWGHAKLAGHQTITDEPSESDAGVSLQFTEEFPTANSHRLYVDVGLENFADVTTSVFSMQSGSSRLLFNNWIPAQQMVGEVLFTPVIRDGAEELFYGVFVSESFTGADATIGRLVFDVSGSDPIEITNDNFILTVGDVLLGSPSAGMVVATMGGVFSRTFDPTVARVYHDSLEQNFPNPFNPTTTLAFSIKSGESVNLTIYDVAGRRVRELVNEHRDRGAYKVVWDGQNDAGQIVASGVYFYKMTAGSFTDTKKMTILK